MKFFTKLNLLALSFAALSLTACHNDDDHVHPSDSSQPGTVTLNFESIFDGTRLALAPAKYVVASNDTVQFTKLKYFVSNIKLTREDGTIYTEPDSYHLIEFSDKKSAETFDLANVPGGNYTKIEFSVGVDSAKNDKTDQELTTMDPENDMTWHWNTSFAFMKITGNYYNTTDKAYKGIHYQIGRNANYRTIKQDLPSKLNVNTAATSIHVKADVKKLFGSVHAIPVQATPTAHGELETNTVSNLFADNYNTMFTVHHIHNHEH